MNDLRERLTELEIRFTHQSLLLDELSDEVSACHRRIDRLEQENAGLRETLRGLSDTPEESPDE